MRFQLNVYDLYQFKMCFLVTLRAPSFVSDSEIIRPKIVDKINYSHKAVPQLKFTRSHRREGINDVTFSSGRHAEMSPFSLSTNLRQNETLPQKIYWQYINIIFTCFEVINFFQVEGVMNQECVCLYSKACEELEVLTKSIFTLIQRLSL